MNSYYELAKLAFPELLFIDGEYECNLMLDVIVSILQGLLTIEEVEELVEYFDSAIKQELINILSEEDKKLIVQELVYATYYDKMIHVKTNDNLNKLMTYAELLEYTWASGADATNYNHILNSSYAPSLEELCIKFSGEIRYGRLSTVLEVNPQDLIDFKPIEPLLPPNFYIIEGE